MTHHFKVALAKEYGIEAAILIDEFNYQISRNKANERNFHDGRYWTYNTLKAYTELFPYLSKDQIKRIIQKLITNGVLVKSNYNENPYNQTSWYAFTDYGLSVVGSCYPDKAELLHPCGEIAKCTNGENAKCKTTTITTTITSISNTPSDEGSDCDLFKDAVASDPPMPTLVEDKLTAPRNKNVTSEEEIAKMKIHIPAYIQAQPETKYRLDFERYIKRRTFESVVYSKDNAVLYDPDAEIQPKKSDADIKVSVNSIYR